jgi:aryl-alcohol dehydrogenase-like predicted oxidoreductase
LTKETTYPEDDWRSGYFTEENLIPSVDRADALRPLVPEGSSMPELALRFILSHPTVSTIIPGMRKIGHVESNIAASSGGRLSPDLLEKLQEHRWVRKPAPWSD